VDDLGEGRGDQQRVHYLAHRPLAHSRALASGQLVDTMMACWHAVSLLDVKSSVAARFDGADVFGWTIGGVGPGCATTCRRIVMRRQTSIHRGDCCTDAARKRGSAPGRSDGREPPRFCSVRMVSTYWVVTARRAIFAGIEPDAHAVGARAEHYNLATPVLHPCSA